MPYALPPDAVPVSLDDVPRWSPWPARLLATDRAVREARTPSSVIREYDTDKYGRLMSLLDANPTLGFEGLKDAEIGTSPVVMSVQDELGLTPARSALECARKAVLDAVDVHVDAGAGLLDIGCGYGYYLHHIAQRHPSLPLRGGELSANARLLGRRLGADVHPFDLLAPSSAITDNIPGPLVVLMVMVVSQLPSAALAIEALSPLRDKIAAVVVVDALDDGRSTSLLGLMRRRYMQHNHYSGDLLQVLRDRPDVEVLDVGTDLVGANFLLPCRSVSWRFT